MVSFDRQQIINLVIGVTGILCVYWVSGLFHERLISSPFMNKLTGKEEKFEFMIPLVLFPSMFTWILGEIYNTRLRERVKIPMKNSFTCGFIVFVSGFTLNKAIEKTSYPVVMAVKASNILAVLLVAVFCTRVRDKSLNLPAKKIILGIIISLGAFIFMYFDPESKDRKTKSELFGIVMLLTSLVADGFLPDFQAQIKSDYKPEPSQMMVQINKYITLISLALTVITLQIFELITFMIYHPWFNVILLCFSVSGFLGQLFIYRLIKQFKQHIVPFVVTIRKIFTIIINLVYFGHKTSLLQLTGMVIVTSAILFEFVSQVQSTKREQKFEKVTEQIEEIETDRANLQISEQEVKDFEKS